METVDAAMQLIPVGQAGLGSSQALRREPHSGRMPRL